MGTLMGPQPHGPMGIAQAVPPHRTGLPAAALRTTAAVCQRAADSGYENRRDRAKEIRKDEVRL